MQLSAALALSTAGSLMVVLAAALFIASGLSLCALISIPGFLLLGYVAKRRAFACAFGGAALIAAYVTYSAFTLHRALAKDG